MTNALKIAFAGTPAFAATIFKALLSQHNVIAAYTQPDRPAGRGRKLTPSPVKQVALEQNIPVFQPLSLRKPQAQAELQTLSPDLLIVVAYGLILPEAVLKIPKYGCLNVHASLLPRWRGAAPIQRAIQSGDPETGVTIMQMDKGLDTGNMLLKKTCPISEADTSSTLHDSLAELGASALLETLANLQQLTPERQDDSLSNYAEKIEKQEGQINWHLPAEEIHRTIRAFHPWPGTFTQLDGKTLKIWQADITATKSNAAPGTIVQTDKKSVSIATTTNLLRITRCQLPGGKAMPVSDLLHAKKDLFIVGKQL